ncbi:MAG: pentapeptide repeat-containing protein [Acidimicrobiales bacterium]
MKFTERRRYLVAAMLAVGALTLSACGGPSNASSALHSSDCTVSATNPNLAGCNLAGQNLSGVDLQSENLRDANLTNANLDNANIQGAKVKGAKTQGVMTNKFTVCVNAEPGPCTQSGLRSPSTADASQGH